jgi:hypothetical protein
MPPIVFKAAAGSFCRQALDLLGCLLLEQLWGQPRPGLQGEPPGACPRSRQGRGEGQRPPPLLLAQRCPLCLWSRYGRPGAGSDGQPAPAAAAGAAAVARYLRLRCRHTAKGCRHHRCCRSAEMALLPLGQPLLHVPLPLPLVLPPAPHAAAAGCHPHRRHPGHPPRPWQSTPHEVLLALGRPWPSWACQTRQS